MLYPISEVRNLLSQLNHPEGLAVARDGSIYAGGETGEVYRISADGMKVQKFAATGGFCLGITLDRDENIYVCDIGRRSLLRVSQRGDVVVLAEQADGRDRKSTRLNSSHRCISYAVFCLKKKN